MHDDLPMAWWDWVIIVVGLLTWAAMALVPVVAHFWPDQP